VGQEFGKGETKYEGTKRLVELLKPFTNYTGFVGQGTQI
jgi:hypothetical protein